MKAILSLVFLVCGMSLAMAQNTVASVKSAAELTSIRDNGKGTITLPVSVSAEDVQNKAKYYVHYFTVDFDATSHVATITMVENEEDSRIVIMRLLSALDIDAVKVGSEIVKREDVFQRYLK